MEQIHRRHSLFVCWLIAQDMVQVTAHVGGK